MIMGVFLAVVAFVGVLALGNRPAEAADQQIPMTYVVVSKMLVSPGTALGAAHLDVKQIPEAEAPATAYRDPNLLVGSVVRRTVAHGQTFDAADFQSQGSARGDDVVRNLKPGLRAMAVKVDQVTGVGTLIQPGDRVDVVIAISDADQKFQVIGDDKPNKEYPDTRFYKTIEDLINTTSVKVLVQNAEVLGTLLQAPPPGSGAAPDASPAPTTNGGMQLTAQEQVVIVAVAPQDVEKIRFGQLDGNLSLVLRSTGDAAATPVDTTGVTLRELVEKHGVLPPKSVYVPLP
jgi:pilus assembly protein CpaB